MTVMTIVGWRAWYADWSVYDSKKMDWADLPDSGVVIVMLYYAERSSSGKRYRDVLSGADWYFRAGTAYGTNHDSHIDPGQWVDPAPVLAKHPNAELKRGEWVDDVTYNRMRATAQRSEWSE
jgi:hypothetical protein